MKSTCVPLLLAALLPLPAAAMPTHTVQDEEALQAVVAHQNPSQALKASNVFERLNEQVPLDTELIDETGRKVKLQDVLAADKPTVLSLVYYDCPSLCSLVLNGITKSVRQVSQTLGEDYQMVSISIDPRDTPEKSAKRRTRQLEALGKPVSAPWHFLTGEDAAVRRIADAVGFGYAFDEPSGQYAHPAVIMVLSPQGRVNRYLYGVDFPPKDLNLAILEAGEGRVGTTFERIILSCFQYDADTKGYSFYIFGFLRIAGVVTLGTLGAMIFLLVRRERQKKPQRPA